MIAAIVARLGEAWLACAAIQAGLWRVAQCTRNAGIVDVGWALTFAVVVVVFAIGARAPVAAWGPVAAIVCVWSVRLGGYLIVRGAASGPEEGRYAELRARWQPHATRRFFVFFQAQALLTAILSSAFVVPFVLRPRCAVLIWLGAALALAGVLGESIADAQLRAFKRTHRGQVCDVGLWAWSRHPNYFFEWCVWIGYAVYGLAFWAWGVVAVAGQAIILGSIFGVTGIPPTENQALRSKGDAYREYQARVSRFVARPPKRS